MPSKRCDERDSKHVEQEVKTNKLSELRGKHEKSSWSARSLGVMRMATDNYIHEKPFTDLRDRSECKPHDTVDANNGFIQK